MVYIYFNFTILLVCFLLSHLQVTEAHMDPLRPTEAWYLELELVLPLEATSSVFTVYTCIHNSEI